MSTEPATPASVRRFTNWRTAVLLGACAGGGLTLNMLVLADPPTSTEVAAPATAPPAVEVAAEQSAEAQTPEPVTTPAPVVSTAPVGEMLAAKISLGTVVSGAPDTADPPAVAAAPVSPAPAIPAPAAPVPQPAAPAATPTPPPAPATTATTTPSVPPPATTPATPPTAAPSPTTSPTTTTPTSTTQPTSTTAAATVSYPYYEIPDVAEIYLTFTDRREISVYSVIRGENWVHEVDTNGPDKVKVKFFNVVTEQEAEFQAELENGKIKVEYGG